MRFQSLPALAALVPLVAADWLIKSPAAGVQLTAGVPIVVTIDDSRAAPPISTFSTFTLELIQGGQDEGTGQKMITQFAGAAAFPENRQITGVVPLVATSDLANSFFFKLTSFAATGGGSYVNWSNRFSITGFSGGPPLDPAVIAAVTALGGATAGPDAINRLGQGGAPGGDVFDIPFNLQTGLTKYAPMQPIPPTKITAKVFKPLFPTSAYSIAKTFLPLPTVQKTVTQPQTFSASSIENPAAPASMPTDMAKYLKRWQD
ncbi:uncharacterized protein K489DRAFT_383794 [Dissoconium aciculare CBS 342.82]|uniref:Yeast cell wall synthesis Kre9/Knh1 C-terminal domain-containing protein n=1 Tax=Dissoconium aciculare CBS 342.82 TaxID=1314786 RepID=A0A6J3LUW1_9PEZI|nr:uncharacterized protein K489DRAFT_383794 [Dissoconium aciculare CBS 342.82]KAF1819560.1 hypothetical protein K489DRAFT_383794 [Dissoconium aciculare CBS 342.82]